MNTDSKIPIKNIYHMLCYAWKLLAYDVDAICGKQKFDNIYNLMARILILHVSKLVKRGFNKEYVSIAQPLSTMRGKIDIQSSIANQTMIKKQLMCIYDEFSPNVQFNQIIKATISTLIKYKRLDRDLRKNLVNLYGYFAKVDDKFPTNQMFAGLMYNRNNQNYRVIINVCRLVFGGLISNEENKELKFSDFIRDNEMSTLYEKFVLNFYEIHLIKSEFHVGSPIIAWGKEYSAPDKVDYLPRMETDIVLTNKQSNTQLIIDTKFYPEALTQSFRSEKQTAKSGHLYQIYTYMSNQKYKFSGRIMGMLLYPTVVSELDINFPFEGKRVMLKTLNLAEDWENIENRLREIASQTYDSSYD